MPQANADIEVKQENKTLPLRSYNVILFDSDEHTAIYVVQMLQELFGHTLEASIKMAEEVHNTGRAIIYTNNLEVCELKAEQVQSYGKDDLATKAGVQCNSSMAVTIEEGV